MMIQKREIFRECFDNFDFKKVAFYTEEDIEQIMQKEGMIRVTHRTRSDDTFFYFTAQFIANNGKGIFLCPDTIKFINLITV